MTEAPLDFVPTPSPEDLARADLYGILARLFYAAPDAQLLAALANAQDDPATQNSPLGEAWHALRRGLSQRVSGDARERAHGAVRRHRQGGGDALPARTTCCAIRATRRSPSCAKRCTAWVWRGARASASTRTTSPA